MRDYGKVFSTFWTSDDTRELSDDGKTLALYLLTGPHTNLIGCFRLPDGYVAEDLKWSANRVSRGFSELLLKGFATRDNTSKWVAIHKYLKWNVIENPNQATAALRLFEQIPDSSEIKSIVAASLKEFGGKHTADRREVFEPFLNPPKTLAEPFLNQDQDQEQDKKQKQKQEGTPAPKPAKEKYGEYGNVLLTHEEHERLSQDYGVEATQEAIKFLDLHLGAKKGGDPYKSHYLAMRKWVFDAVQERKGKQPARASPPPSGQSRGLKAGADDMFEQLRKELDPQGGDDDDP